MGDVIGILKLLEAKDAISFLVLHFTTSIMVMYVAVKLFGINFKWIKLLIAAFLYAIAMTMIRKVYTFYEIPLGTHTLYLMLIKTIIMYILLELKLVEAVIGSILTSILILSATPAALWIIKILNIDFKSFANNPWLFSIVGHVEGIYLMLAVAVLSITNLNVYKTFNWER